MVMNVKIPGYLESVFFPFAGIFKVNGFK